jgi:hypothetical protein
MAYNPGEYGDAVNVFVSVNKTIKDGVPISGKSRKQCIAKSWYFHKEEERIIREAFENGTTVTVTGIERGVQRGTYIAASYEIVDIAGENDDVGITRRVAFNLNKRIFEGGPIYSGKIGMHAVVVQY